ncbi:uncharacterized protein LOC143292042 [Babylonia areolata]|uniref:uncharacterized protein LOC143292042 n=1 Tax=Babylonia areolata TaxID=304850 RepID=UPI003FD5C831
MDGKIAFCQIALFCLLFDRKARVVTADDGSSGPLKCYDCLNTFKYRWDPYTPCQINATSVPVATCLITDRFCKVQRVTVKGITIKIARSCAGVCYYGCTFYSFGVTQLHCTSCCNQSLCNTGSGAPASVVVMAPTARRSWRAVLPDSFVWVVFVMLSNRWLWY